MEAYAMEANVMEALTNERWGFESNCFVCEPRNDAGLRIPFFHDRETGVVTATFTLDGRFSGAPSYVHGGVLLAVLDEAMAWATIAIAHRWAVTGETTTRFEHPVRVDRTYTVIARVTEPVSDDPSTLATAAEVRDAQGRRCAIASATFVVLGEAQAADAVGVDVGGDPGNRVDGAGVDSDDVDRAGIDAIGINAAGIDGAHHGVGDANRGNVDGACLGAGYVRPA